MELKDILKKLRADKGMSQNELAEKLHCSNATIGYYETGKRYPNKEMAEAIADFFNVSLDYLYGRDEKSVYYLDPETAEIAQQMFERPEMKTLFDASRKATKEDIEQVADILKKLSENN